MLKSLHSQPSWWVGSLLHISCWLFKAMDIDNESKDNTKKGWKQLHVWNGSLIADMFQEGLEEQITKAVVLATWVAILFFMQWSCKGGLPFGNARDVGFSLDRTHQMSWYDSSGRLPSHCRCYCGKRTKARGPGHPHGMTKVIRTLTTAYDMEEWMWGMEEDAPKVEVRNGHAINHRPEWRNTHSQHTGWGSGTEGKENHSFLETLLVVHPLLGVRVLIGEAIKVPSIQP